MATTKKQTSAGSAEIAILPIHRGTVDFWIIGDTPLIFNRMSEKAKRQLLMPRARMTDADKAENLKHDPEREYRDSVYRNYGDGRVTRLAFPKEAFKGAMCTAALDLPGASKTAIGRLVTIGGTHVDVYGIPRLYMVAVRSADIGRTPDIRTRAIVSEWCCHVTISYMEPKLNARSTTNLFAAAGILAGIGDFRQEKGKGDYGLFHVVDAHDADLQRIKETGAREAQDAALLNASCYDGDTDELLTWYKTEVLRLGRAPKAAESPARAPVLEEAELTTDELVALAAKKRARRGNGEARP